MTPPSYALRQITENLQYIAMYIFYIVGMWIWRSWRKMATGTTCNSPLDLDNQVPVSLRYIDQSPTGRIQQTSFQWLQHKLTDTQRLLNSLCSSGQLAQRCSPPRFQAAVTVQGVRKAPPPSPPKHQQIWFDFKCCLQTDLVQNVANVLFYKYAWFWNRVVVKIRPQENKQTKFSRNKINSSIHSMLHVAGFSELCV